MHQRIQEEESMSNQKYGINEDDKLPADVQDFAEPHVINELIRHRPEALLGGFWRIKAEPDGGNFKTDSQGLFSGIGFLSGIDINPPPSVPKFYFIIFPRKDKTEVLTVKSTSSLWSLSKAELNMSPDEDMSFKINVMLKPAYCSPELLPKLFDNIRKLHSEGALRVDWIQMRQMLPKNVDPDSNWKRVVDFVYEIAEL